MTVNPNSLPLVTFAIFCYNQEAYIRDAIAGAFAQEYPRLQILISDDCSRDATFDIVQKMVSEYDGPHRITCVRNHSNIGIAEHVNQVNRSAQGELIVVAAGDDISLPQRTRMIVQAYLASGRQSHYLYSSVSEMDLSGNPGRKIVSPGASCAGSKLRTALSPYPLAIGAGQAWTKALTEAFAPLGPAVWAEDQVFGLRGILLGPVTFIDQPLVRYRIGSGISTVHKPFSVRRYFAGRWSALHIYRQRGADAGRNGNYGLALAVSAKILVQTMTLPFAPFVSALIKIFNFR